MMSEHLSKTHLESIEEPFHLDYDEHLKPYVDGQSNEIDREIVESHVALCSLCEEELKDLQAFSKQPVHTRTEPSFGVGPTRARQWLPQWRWPRLASPLAVASVLGLIILGITLAVLMWTMRPASGPVRHAGPTASPEVDKSSTANATESPAPSSREHASAGNAANDAGQPERKRDESRPRGEEPLLALNDGGDQVSLNRQGQMIGLEELPPDLRQTVAHVLTTRRFEGSPGLRDLAESSRTLRGGIEERNTLQVLAPVGIVIESNRPTFRWRALEGARDYIVRIYDSRLRHVESSGPLSGTEWMISKPLQRGVTYSWQIRAVKDGETVLSPKPPAPEARFRVLDRESFAALENAKRRHSNSHLAMGVLYWKHGLIDKAEREFQALVAANPDSPVAAQLLKSLR